MCVSSGLLMGYVFKRDAFNCAVREMYLGNSASLKGPGEPKRTL
jgi:hypothetical protein